MSDQPVDPAVDPTASPAVLVQNRRDLDNLAAEVAGRDVVALDIEANSLHAYREQACVLQMTADGHSAIVDLLALSDLDPLARVLDREGVEVVFHGGDFDVSLLSRDHGFKFRRVFDTMIAATILGEPKVGLADLVRDTYGVELDKRYQKVDWAKRPLTPEQVDYLHRDTAFLPDLRNRLRERLIEADLVEEAEIEFRRLAMRRGKTPVYDPDSWRRLKGASTLDVRGRAILARLHAWRERAAKRRDLPPFKVLPPRLMVELAARPPDRLRDARDLKTLSPGLRRRYGDAVVKALRAGSNDAREGRGPPKDTKPKPSPEERKRRRRERVKEDALRAWRREEAQRRNVPNLVVLPNRAVGWIVQEEPKTLEALAMHPDVGAKRADRYGAAILDVLAKARNA